MNTQDTYDSLYSRYLLISEEVKFILKPSEKKYKVNFVFMKICEICNVIYIANNSNIDDRYNKFIEDCLNLLLTLKKFYDKLAGDASFLNNVVDDKRLKTFNLKKTFNSDSNIILYKYIMGLVMGYVTIQNMEIMQLSEDNYVYMDRIQYLRIPFIANYTDWKLIIHYHNNEQQKYPIYVNNDKSFYYINCSYIKDMKNNKDNPVVWRPQFWGFNGEQIFVPISGTGLLIMYDDSYKMIYAQIIKNLSIHGDGDKRLSDNTNYHIYEALNKRVNNIIYIVWKWIYSDKIPDEDKKYDDTKTFYGMYDCNNYYYSGRISNGSPAGISDSVKKMLPNIINNLERLKVKHDEHMSEPTIIDAINEEVQNDKFDYNDKFLISLTPAESARYKASLKK